MAGLRFLAVALSLFVAASAQGVEGDWFRYHAERYGVDDDLLRAIARVESQGHPWTLNVDGVPFYLPSKAAAVSLVDELRTRPWILTVEGPGGRTQKLLFAEQVEAERYVAGLRGAEAHDLVLVDAHNVDVGVMQVNWRWHGEGVPSLERLLDVDYNVAYGAYYLASLIREHGVRRGLAYYHSRDPERGAAYVERVMREYSRVRRGS